MVIPMSMGVSTLLNGTLGFAMLLALLFCMPNDIESVLDSETNYPFMNIYAYAVGSTKGANAMVGPFCVWSENLKYILDSPGDCNDGARNFRLSFLTLVDFTH